MSKYEWERGTIVIPANAWVSFRRRLIDAWNAEQERLFQLAIKMRDEVEGAAKGKRGFDREAWLRERMNATSWGSDGGSASISDYDEVIRLVGLRGRIVDGKFVSPKTTAKTKAPKRKDLKILPRSKGASMDLGDALITLDDATHSVTWYVTENNHACDCARSLPMAKELFAALAGVTWTRGSGGKIIGNDEYNRDSDYEGGGGNYVTAEFGPNVKRSASGRRWY